MKISGKWRRRILGLAIILVVLIVLILLAKNLFEGPAKGTVSNPASDSKSQSSDSSVSVTGKYIVFQYPGGFKAHTTDKPQAPILESYDYSSSDFPAADLSVSVSLLPSGNLEDSSAYKLRQTQPDKYKLEDWVINGKAVKVFVEQDSTSNVAFIPHSGKLLTVTMTGGDPDTSKGEQIDVISSVRWQNV